MVVVDVARPRECLLEESNLIALLFEDGPSRNGIISLNNIGISVHFVSMSTSLLLEKCSQPKIILPEWLVTVYPEIHPIDIEFIKNSKEPMVEVTLEFVHGTVIPSPFCLDTFKASLVGLQVSSGLHFQVNSSGIPLYVRVASTMEGSGVITEETRIILHQDRLAESTSDLVDLYKEDLANFDLLAKAARLPISDELNDKALVYCLYTKQIRCWPVFENSVAANSVARVDLVGIAEDDEADDDHEVVDHLVRRLPQNDALIVLRMVDLYRSDVALKRLRSLFEAIASSPSSTVWLSCLERPSRLLTLLSRNDRFQVVEFSPSPLSNAARLAYLSQRLGIDGKTLNSYKWRMNGLELSELDALIEEFNVAEGTFDIKLNRALELVASSSRPQYLKVLGKGLGSWEEMLGYADIKAKIIQLLYGPVENPELYAKFGLGRSPGILLYGPSGCGKSSMVHAIANDGTFSVLQLDLAALKSKYLGETEERLRACFAQARQNAPCILFIDEIDTLGKRRGLTGEGAGGVEERLLSTMLNEIDGIEELGQVIIIGCTNKPDQIDSALKRPGRLDTHILVDRPSQEDIGTIVRHWSSILGVEVESSQFIGLSCADIVQYFQELGREQINTLLG